MFGPLKASAAFFSTVYDYTFGSVTIGADTGGGMRGSISPLSFHAVLLVLLFLCGLSPREQKKIFRLAALAIIIPPTCESESAPLFVTDQM
jgi:hypothetical protein